MGEPENQQISQMEIEASSAAWAGAERQSHCVGARKGFSARIVRQLRWAADFFPTAIGLRFVAQAWNNPIVLKELRPHVPCGPWMRSWRALVVLSIHLVVLSCFVSILYFAVVESERQSSSPLPWDRGAIDPTKPTAAPTPWGCGELGVPWGRQTLFYSTYMLLLTLAVFLSPSFTAGSISGERERKTLDLLITTSLPTRSLVLGKLTPALAYIVLLILTALPIQGLALVFGGIALSEVIIGTLILFATALIAGTIGIFVSSFTRSPTVSTVLTYATILLAALGLPILAIVMLVTLGSALIPSSDLNWVLQAGLIYVGGFLICTNPFATAVATKILEEEKNSLFFFTIQVTGSNGDPRTLPLLSPWIVYVLFYVAVSTLLIFFSIWIIEHKRG